LQSQNIDFNNETFLVIARGHGAREADATTDPQIPLREAENDSPVALASVLFREATLGVMCS